MGLLVIKWRFSINDRIKLITNRYYSRYASISEGLWYARSEEFMQQPLFDTLRWVRLGGDVVFIFGALAFFWQIFTMIFFKPKKTA